MANYLAMYLRLSQDDVNTTKDESDSINSQRMLIRQYINTHSDLASLSIIEFVDDGFTGTNFDRPEFQRMLAMVRAGDITSIIVKDLSRFGRNYLDVGDYLEHIFPFLGVRFIAINDNYDSNTYFGTTGGVDVAFRNLVYQRYSQDLSQKVKSAMHLKMKRGKYITNCPYGYKKKPGVKHEIIIDPVTAPIVREIFCSAIAGMKSTEIAAMLNEKQIPTPMVYKQLDRKDMHNDAMWSHQAVLRIIKEYKYTGAMVNFRCENETIRATVQRKCSPEEWVIVENSHEAIVTHEEYKSANESIRKVHYMGAKSKDTSDRVYYCAYCGRHLRKTFGIDEYYSCASKLYLTNSPCCNIKWSRTELESVVLSAYKVQLNLMNDAYRKKVQCKSAPIDDCRNAQKDIQKELDLCTSQNFALYERYRNGEFSKNMFLEKKTEILQQKEKLQSQLTDLQSEEAALISQQNKEAEQIRTLKASANMLSATDDELRTHMYDAIEKVVVYATKEIEIHWKFEIDFGTKDVIKEA